jgi:energy-converting hydrogenase B subunit Q
MSDRVLGLHVRARSGPGILHQLSGVIALHQGDITSVEIVERTPDESRVYFEVELPGMPDALLSDLRGLDSVRALEVVETFQRVYGKRIIIMGGGAQVGQVAIGAISEADRHNIRGERISVDTIPLVGEKPLAPPPRSRRRCERSPACHGPARWCSPGR